MSIILISASSKTTFSNKTFTELQFDLTSTTAIVEGMMRWEEVDGTVVMGLPGGNVHAHLTQNLFVPKRSKNTSGTEMVRGTVVYINGVSGNKTTIARADATSSATSDRTIGVCAEDISNNGLGNVITYGKLEGTALEPVNTSGFIEGGEVWLSETTGEFTDVKPTSPAHAVFLGFTLRAHATEGEIFVKITNGYQYNELHDVDDSLSSPTAGQLTAWDAVASLWKQTVELAYDFINDKLLFGANSEMGISNGLIETDLIAPADLILKCGALKTLELTTTIFEDIFMPLAGAKVPASNAPTWATYSANLNSYTFGLNDFSDLNAVELNHGYKEETDIEAHVHIITNGSDVDDRTVKFTLYFDWGNATAEMDGELSLTGEITIPASTPTKTHYYVELGTTTGTGKLLGSLFKSRVKRIASTGTEPSSDPFVEMVGVHIQKNTIGSRQENIK